MAYRYSTVRKSVRLCKDAEAALREQKNMNGYINRAVYEYMRAYERKWLRDEWYPSEYIGQNTSLPFNMLLREDLAMKPAQYGLTLSSIVNQAILWQSARKMR